MKDREIMEAFERCTYSQGCEKCPYYGNESCIDALIEDAFELCKKLYEQPTTACDYEAISHKLGEELERVEIENERIQSELSEAQKELAYLRAVKATTEAFLGVKI